MTPILASQIRMERARKTAIAVLDLNGYAVVLDYAAIVALNAASARIIEQIQINRDNVPAD